MKISKDGVIPQVEPKGAGRRWLIRIGGAKRLFQRAGGFMMQPITMFSAMTGAWATFKPLQALFFHRLWLFFLTAIVVISVWMIVYYSLILSPEQSWGQTQSQRSERSPLKRDTEAILEQLEEIDGQSEDIDG